MRSFMHFLQCSLSIRCFNSGYTVVPIAFIKAYIFGISAIEVFNCSMAGNIG